MDLAVAGQFADALPLYDEAIKLDPSSARYHSDKAISHLNLGQYRECIAESLKATELDPAMPEPWINRGAAYGRLGEYGEAERALEQARMLAPDNPYMKHNLGVLTEKQQGLAPGSRSAAVMTEMAKQEPENIDKAAIFRGVNTGVLLNPRIGGFALGMGFSYAFRVQSVYLEGGILVMFCFLLIWHYGSLYEIYRTVSKKPDIPEYVRLLYSRPVVPLFQTLAYMGGTFLSGYLAGWALHLVFSR